MGNKNKKSEHDKARSAFVTLHKYCISRNMDCSNCCFIIPTLNETHCFAQDYGEERVVDKDLLNQIKDRCKQLNTVKEKKK